jgi:hypothetical protein
MTIAAKLTLLQQTKQAQKELLGIPNGVPWSKYASYMTKWLPYILFMRGRNGAWYDPSDLSTLFQNAAGTIPVTTNGDPVALMLDKSGNGYHMAQTTSTARPTYRTDGILHWLQPDGIDDGMLRRGIPVTTLNREHFTACTSTASEGVQLVESASYPLVMAENYSDGVSVSHTTADISSRDINGKNQSVSMFMSSENPSILQSKVNNGTLTGGVNNSANSIVFAPRLPVENMTVNLYLFRFTQSARYFYGGKFYGGLYLYDSELDAQTANRVRRYLAQKAGIAL